MGVVSPDSMVMYCDIQVAMDIVNNPVSHERTKHIEVDCHFIWDMAMSKRIATSFTSGAQKLYFEPFSTLRNKLEMIDIYAPAWGGVLEYLEAKL